MRCGIAARLFLMAVGVLVFTGVLVGALHSVLALNRVSKNFRLRDWNPHFIVHAGAEIGGRRRYRGRVWKARLCAGSPPGKVRVTPGADVGARLQLTAVAEESQQVEVSAYVWSNTDKQSGPARIVTFSSGPSFRNVTLAQHERDLIFRIRTPWTGDGLHPQFALPNVVQTGSPTWVIATFVCTWPHESGSS
jgi:hypothetical protein